MRKLIVVVCLTGYWLSVLAQKNDSTALYVTLAEARAYALANSPIIKSSTLDIEAAKKKIWETTAIGLPQVSGKYSYSYIITLPEIYKQFAAMGSAGGGGAAPNLDDLRTTSTLDVTVSQLLFSGSYIVGLQTSKVYKNLSELSLTKSKQDLLESINNSYILVLIVRENKKLVDSLYRNTNNMLESMKAMLAQGFLEETDIDQLQITVNTLQNNVDMLERQALIAERLLKFQLGYPLDQPIYLTDSIDKLVSAISDESFLLSNFDVDKLVDYQLLDTQTKLMNLNLKLNKSAFLPEVAAFYQHDKNFNTKAITFTPPDLIGLSVNIPIFSSGMRLARVSQARINYEKAKITQQQAAESLQINFEDSKSKYLTALNNYKTAVKNLELAEKIYQRSLIKYKEGTISSIELTQVQNQYLQNQSNYFNTIIELNNARNKVEKLLTPAN